jgi:ion channel-forming bestrophin family protein
MENNQTWFSQAFQLNGSVIPLILPRLIFFAGFAELVAVLHFYQIPFLEKIPGQLTANVVYNLVLGLLLVFRTNTAYDRYWEGRKAWGTIVFNLRSLAREMRVRIPENEPEDSVTKTTAIKLLAAFAIATKHYLRHEAIEESTEIRDLIGETEINKLKETNHPPLEISIWLGSYLESEYRQNRLDAARILELNNLLNGMVEGLTGCERILRTPMPIAYNIYLKRLILIYCLFLPFHLAPELQLWTGLVVAVIGFILLGIEQVGSQLEDPFGYDLNDLPLDSICRSVTENVQTTLASVLPFSASNSDEIGLIN